MSVKKFLGLLLLAGFGATSAAHATSMVVLKVSDSGTPVGDVIDPHLDWTEMGGVNEAIAGGTDLTNNGVDFKDSWVDSNWDQVIKARVSMYSMGQEVAYMDFDTVGSTKSDFFSISRVTASSWGVPPLDQTNIFSIAGDAGINRHWYANRNYGGCGIDRGVMAVLDNTTGGGFVCTWSSQYNPTGNPNRGFLYAIGPSNTNYNNTATTGVADVFAVTVYTEMAPIPVPASLPLLAAALGIFGVVRRLRG